MRFITHTPNQERYIESNGIRFYVRDEASDSERNWDEHIIQEVVENDTYDLKSLSKENGDLRSVLDIGAHIGGFSVYSIILWPMATIDSYEPFESNFRLLNKNIEGFKDRIKSHCIAVLPGPAKKVRFRGPAIGKGSGCNTGDGAIDENGEIEVQGQDILEIVRKIKTVDLMKLDCEGVEGDLIKRLAENNELKSVRHVRGEFHGDWNAKSLFESFKETHDFSFKFTYQKMGLFRADLK